MATNRGRSQRSLITKISSLDSKVDDQGKSTAKPHLFAGDIEEANLAENSVSARSIALGAVDSTHISRGAVGTENLGVINEINSDGSFVLNVPEGTAFVSGSGLDVEGQIFQNNGRAVEQYTLLQRPFFQAASNTQQNKSGTASQVRVAFANELVDNLGRYNAGLSRFTALDDGLHQFSVSLATDSVSTGPEISLRKNNVTLYSNLAIGYGGSYQTFGATVIAYLAAGDFIEVWLNNNNNTSVSLSSGRCYFSGYYIG